jgi:hypothetical protein
VELLSKYGAILSVAMAAAIHVGPLHSRDHWMIFSAGQGRYDMIKCVAFTFAGSNDSTVANNKVTYDIEVAMTFMTCPAEGPTRERPEPSGPVAPCS